MKVVCILCDRFFEPDKLQIKKIHKHPHRIQICADCHERIGKVTRLRQLHSND